MMGCWRGFWENAQNMHSSKNCNILDEEDGYGGGLVKERSDFPIMLHFFFSPKRRVNSHTAYVIKKSSNM